MKRLLFSLPLFLLAFQSCDNIEDIYAYGNGAADIEWEAVADSCSTSLLAHFWNGNEHYFNQGSDNSDNTFGYWPQAHAMDVVIDAFLRTGDSRYSNLFPLWYEGVGEKNKPNDWETKTKYWNDFYDDMEWNALTMIRLYEATGDRKYLDTAQSLWTEIKTGWNDYAGGGIAWTHSMPYSKNACSNGPAALVAVRMYQVAKQDEDLDWAKKIYRWERDNLFNPATGAVYDNMNGETGEVNTLSLSYNQGTFLGAAHELYSLTGDALYLKDARKAAYFGISNSGMIDSGNNVLRDEGSGDGALFKGIFMRYFVKLLLEPDLEENYRKKFVTFFNNNAYIAWTQGVNKLDMLFGTDWAQQPSGNEELNAQVSACTLIEAKALFDRSIR